MIPTVDDVRSSPLVHRFGDLFNPPGLTNRLGCVQADHDVTAIRSLSFPPFGAGDVSTASLFLNGRLFVSTGAPVTYTWSPDRIVREATWDDLHVRSITSMPIGERAAMVLIEITNRAGVARDLDIRLGLRSGVTRKDDPWNEPLPPIAYSHDISAGADGVAFRDARACGVQGALPPADDWGADFLHWRRRAEPHQTIAIRFVSAYAHDESGARSIVRRLTADFDRVLEATRDDWNEELRAIFTPGNDRYGGSLPVLETTDDNLRRAWLSGILGVVMFRREPAALGRSYDTLMPRYWQGVTFLWDYSLSSVMHAMLDPQVMRTHLEHWMATDIHSCFGTDRMAGAPIGPWYSVNDYAMCKMIADYLRWTGDMGWLDHEVAGMPVHRHVERFATSWRSFAVDGLADYGGIGNLLECVSTYVHQVASLNAANVWSIRFAADLAELRDHAASSGSRAQILRAEADELSSRLIESLYVKGEGYWNARHPTGDGSWRDVPVKHCYDFLTLLTTIDGDLTHAQRDEMVTFFDRELRTPTWMHALSPYDPDALYSIRPDHQWTGAYPAWPPLSLLGLLRAGKEDLAAAWMRGLGASGNQGPFGQAHFVESIVAPDAGGAAKVPSDAPYINDWAVSSGGAWVWAILEGVFGVTTTLHDIQSTPRIRAFDPGARLRNLPWRGRLYDVDASGLHEVKGAE